MIEVVVLVCLVFVIFELKSFYKISLWKYYIFLLFYVRLIFLYFYYAFLDSKSESDKSDCQKTSDCEFDSKKGSDSTIKKNKKGNGKSDSELDNGKSKLHYLLYKFWICCLTKSEQN